MRKRYRIRLTDTQRITLLVALRHWQKSGCPIPEEFRRTHEATAADAVEVEEQLHAPEPATVDIAVTLEQGQLKSIIVANQHDVAIHLLRVGNLDPSHSLRRVEEMNATVESFPVVRNTRLIKKLRASS